VADVDLTAASAQYEAAFRGNRDDAAENGYDLICPICGCAFNEDEPWEMSHDRPLHGLYDAMRGGA
jgi:hypothetical protein